MVDLIVGVIPCKHHESDIQEVYMYTDIEQISITTRTAIMLK